MSQSPRIAAPTLITAHANADFDALAAIVAAGRLYPDAVLVFPGAQERNLRNFFIESATYMFGVRQARDIDLATVRLLVVVDTRQRSRIPHVEAALDNPGLEIHLWDHHPDTDDDLPATFSRVLSWGATTSIIVHELRERGISLTEDEATMLGLGIYEDTGSFTFNSTTPHDFSAAAWLREQGMELNTIAELITRNLTSEQVQTLNTLLETATTHEIRGIPVVIAEASMDAYMGDFAVLAHKMMDMESIKVLFTLARMGDRVQVVARSRLPDVDVGAICKALGGGGHAYAASASVKDKTPQEVRDELFGLLYLAINPEVSARDLMSAPVVGVEEDRSIRDAEEVMNRFGLKAVPVFASGTRACVGYLEYQTATRALTHGLGDMPVTEYMQRKVRVVGRDTALQEVMDIIVGHRQRLVPVVEDDNVVGVVTRTDLINAIVDEPARIPEALLPESRKERNIAPLIAEKLPPSLLALLQRAGRLGERLGVSVYAVGGFVRDLLLDRPNYDLDLVIEGDGVAFARVFAAEVGGRLREHAKFKTALVIFTDENGAEQRVDVATARLEYYEYPAALPTVELSSIKMDLFRRDFTINALAVQLDGAQFGRLVDFFGSQRDMKDKGIRVLHSLSFVEDPTRILRAVRFAVRYDFSIGPQTQRLIKNALGLGLMGRLSGPRIFHELRLILEEQAPVECLARLEHFGVLEAIHPLFKLTPSRTNLLESTEQVLNWYRLLYLDEEPQRWLIYLLALCLNMKYKESASIADRLALPPSARNAFLSTRETLRSTGPKVEKWMREEGPLSELYALLKPLALEGVLHMMARSKSEDLRRHVSQFLTRLQHEKLDINGDDLRAMGLPPSPAYGRVLQHVLAAKLDGHAPTRTVQLECAYTLVRGELAQAMEEGVAQVGRSV